MSSHQHKPGTLKQSNKKHKGSAASKRSVKRSFGAGKVEKRSGSGGAGGSGGGGVKSGATSNMAMEAKFRRTSRDNNTRKLDRMNLWLQKRVGSISGHHTAAAAGSGEGDNYRLSCSGAPPKVVVFVPLSAAAAACNLIASCTEGDEPASCAVFKSTAWPASAASSTVVHSAVYTSSKYRMKCAYMQPALTVAAVVEAVKMADIVVYHLRVVPGVTGATAAAAAESASPALAADLDAGGGLIDERGFAVLTALRAVGTPSAACCVTGLHDTKHSGGAAKVHELKASAARVAASFINREIKVVEYNYISSGASAGASAGAGATGATNSSNNQLLRLISETTPPSTSCVDSVDAVLRSAAAVSAGSGSSSGEPSDAVSLSVADRSTASGSSTTGSMVSWRRDRTYMMADSYTTSPSPSTGAGAGMGGEDAQTGETLVTIRGFVRNRPLKVNSLLHFVGVGTGAIVSVKSAAGSTAPLGAAGSTAAGAGCTGAVYSANAGTQESLTPTAAADVLAGEQTWPLEGEEEGGMMFDGGAEEGPEGGAAATTHKANTTTNAYHDEWFEEDEEEGEDFNDADLETGSALGSVGAGGRRLTKVNPVNSLLQNPRPTLGANGAPSALFKHKAYPPVTQENIDRFQDEVDSPDLPLSVRSQFAKYRSLQSFRFSDWHPKENLPTDYAKIYQFAHFNVTQRAELGKVRSVAALQDTILCAQHFYKEKLAGSGFGTGAGAGAGAGADGDSDGGMEEESAAAATSTAGDSSGARSITVPNTNNEYIMSGEYVEITVRGLDASLLQGVFQENGGVFFVYGMMKHENKLSVCHINLTTLPAYEEEFCGVVGTGAKAEMHDILRSKASLVFQIGFRTPLVTNPIFSETNLNCDKSKMCRYLEAGKFTTATIMAPVTYLPAPVLIYAPRPRSRTASANNAVGHPNLLTDATVTTATSAAALPEFNDLVLIATGVMDAVDPDRIILKKAILTGVPVRVKKRFGVVRYMFNEPTDVKYYKPAELYTKHGLRGHIREPIGTHGLFKAIFNAPVKQNDTVMLILYKRVFPKLLQGGAAASGSGPGGATDGDSMGGDVSDEES